jgi:hypothetical protein
MSEIDTGEQEAPLNQRYFGLFEKQYRLWLFLNQHGALLQHMSLTIPYEQGNISTRLVPDLGITLTYMPKNPDKDHIFAATLGFHRLGMKSDDRSHPISSIKVGMSLLTIQKTGEIAKNLLGKEYDVERRELPGISFTMSGLNALVDQDGQNFSKIPELQPLEELLANSQPVISDVSVGFGSEDSSDPQVRAAIQDAVVGFWESILTFV